MGGFIVVRPSIGLWGILIIGLTVIVHLSFLWLILVVDVLWGVETGDV